MSPVTDHDEIAAWLYRLLAEQNPQMDRYGMAHAAASILAPHVAAQIEAATTAERAATVEFLKRWPHAASAGSAMLIEKGEHL